MLHAGCCAEKSVWLLEKLDRFTTTVGRDSELQHQTKHIQTPNTVEERVIGRDNRSSTLHAGGQRFESSIVHH